jgi:hypothetical protein
MKLPEVILVPLQPEDREQFILDNQWAVEFWNKHHHGPTVSEEEEGNWSMDDEMFVLQKKEA